MVTGQCLLALKISSILLFLLEIVDIVDFPMVKFTYIHKVLQLFNPNSTECSLIEYNTLECLYRHIQQNIST